MPPKPTAKIRTGWPRRAQEGSFNAKNAQVITLKSAVYNATTHKVILTPKTPFALTKPVQLQVDGLPPKGLKDSLGRLIDGDHNGKPGGNAVAVLSHSGVTISAVSYHAAPAIRLSLLKSAAVDLLQEREDAIAVKHPTRAERPFQEYTATSQRTADPDEAIPPMAQIRVDWKPPLQPWTEWAPAVDRFAVPIDASPRSRGNFAFESSGLPSPGRRSDGSAERRKRNRQS